MRWSRRQQRAVGRRRERRHGAAGEVSRNHALICADEVAGRDRRRWGRVQVGQAAVPADGEGHHGAAGRWWAALGGDAHRGVEQLLPLDCYRRGAVEAAQVGVLLARERARLGVEVEDVDGEDESCQRARSSLRARDTFCALQGA